MGTQMNINWAALSETAGKIDYLVEDLNTQAITYQTFYSKLENLLEDLVDEHTKLADELIDESFREGYKECQSDFSCKYFYVILEDTGEESFIHEQGFVSWDKVFAELKRLEEEIPTSSFTSYSVRVED